MTALDKLIEAVEAEGYDATPDRAARFNDFSEAWEAARGAYTQPGYKTTWHAYQGSLDAADTLMTILPEGAKWMRMSDGAFIVWVPGTSVSASADATGNISRDLFLAILRAYRSVQP